MRLNARAMRIGQFFLAAALGLAAARPAAAGGEADLAALAFGPFNVNGSGNGERALELRAEYRPAWSLWLIRPLAGLTVTTDGGLYGYAGLLADVPLGAHLRLTPSFAAGLYGEGQGVDLGSVVEFRSGIEVAWRFDNAVRVGVSFYHLSNAGIGEQNPGTEVASLVFALPLGR